MKEKAYESHSMTLGTLLNISKPQTAHTSCNYYEGKVKCLKLWAQCLVFYNLSLNLRYYRVVLIPLGTQRNYRPRINLRSVVISVSLVICRGCSFSIMIPSSGYELCSREQCREEHLNPEVRPTFVARITTLMEVLNDSDTGEFGEENCPGQKNKVKISGEEMGGVRKFSLKIRLGFIPGGNGNLFLSRQKCGFLGEKERVPLHDFGGTYSKTKSM